MTADLEVDRRGHEFRYRLAAGFLDVGDVVLDAACGTGYGAPLLQARGGVLYVGVDVDLSDLEVERSRGRDFVEVDLTDPEVHRRVSSPFDVFVGFETMEHLSDWRPWVDLAKRAGSWVLVSVPVVPTVGQNPHHLHDFEPGEVPGYFEDECWATWQVLPQPSEFSEVYVFQRRVSK